MEERQDDNSNRKQKKLKENLLWSQLAHHESHSSEPNIEPKD
jgi:hypothetical protein